MESRSLIDLHANCHGYGVFLQDNHSKKYYFADQIEDY